MSIETPVIDLRDRDMDSLAPPELILDPANPMQTARIFVDHRHVFNGVSALHHQSGLFFEWNPETNAYYAVDEAEIRSRVYKFLEKAKRLNNRGVILEFQPNKSKVENALDSIKAVCNIPSKKAAPCWLDSTEIQPVDVTACRNGLLYVPERRLLSPTPHFFTLNGIHLDFDPNAPRPENWFKFLAELWREDESSIATLQEWFGLLLTLRTHFQKMLMLVGPKRSGKGTIARVIRHLCGELNVTGPTLANMAEQFGMSGLIGKSVALIADARISGRADTSVITERLLTISGEDALSIPRKFLPDWNGKLSTRFVLMTNELPRIEDQSGALASRFIVLTLNESFYGREDHQLLDRFIPELPGILLWALDGLDRLTNRGRFIQPESAAEMIQQLEDLGSPIGAFIRERCDVGAGSEVPIDRAFDAWKDWCETNGRERPGSVQTFGRNLKAAIPALKLSQHRILGHRVRYYEGIQLQVSGT